MQQNRQTADALGVSKSSKKMKDVNIADNKGSDEFGLRLDALKESSPPMIRDAIVYLEDNWGLRKIEKMVMALGIKSLDDLRTAVDWQKLKQKASSRPAKVAAVAVAGIGLVVLARQLMKDGKSASGRDVH